MGTKEEQILKSVAGLYQRYGIKSVTMDDVATHLGISKKTLYQYFRDKEDLVRKVTLADKEQRHFILQAVQSVERNAIEELFEVYKILKAMFRQENPAILYDLRKYYPELYMELREQHRLMHMEAGLRNLVKGKAEGLYREDLDERIIAKLHLFTVENIRDCDMFPVGELTSFRVFHELFVYHLNGILSPEGRVYFEQHFWEFRDTVQHSG